MLRHEKHRDAFRHRHTIASLITAVPIPERRAGIIRRSQLKSIDRLTVFMVLANLLGTLLAMSLYQTAGEAHKLGFWATGICIACAGLYLGSANYRAAPPTESHLPRVSLTYIVMAMVFGCLWGSLPALIVSTEDPISHMAIGVLMCALAFAGALLLGRLPQAAFGFVIPVLLGLGASFLAAEDSRTNDLALVVLVYGIVLTVSIRWYSNQFVTQQLSDLANAEQGELIGLLLRDFEESTADWLWQTDAKGVLCDIPLTLEGRKDGYAMMPSGRKIVDVFDIGQPRTILQACIANHEGFRDLVLPLSIEDAPEPRWLSLTGKPLYEEGVLIGYRGVASDITSSKQIEDRIAYMAHYDGLTGLPNRATYQERLEKLCARTPRGRGVFAVAIMDLDNFKWVNDTLGHGAGDDVLRSVSERLTETLRPGDTVARLGGDEFALILRRDDMSSLEATMFMLVGNLSEPYLIWSTTVNCSASFGLRVLGEGPEEADALMTQADLALYKTKNDSKGSWCLFTEELDKNARARRLIEADLQSAQRRNELSLNYQPIINAHSGKATSLEALMRWHHPSRGLILPSDFVAQAENCGLISKMGEWVIRTALSELQRLPESVKVSVNISPLQLHSTNLVPTIVNALAYTGIAAHRLDLEITESVLLSESQFVLDRLNQLRALGLTITLDDFGTGFSSLKYLQVFPFNKIKVDKAFVADLETNEDSRTIVRATVGLAKSLGLECTAEGVETEMQEAFLKEIGCDELQGFRYSRPRPLSLLGKWVSLMPEIEARQTKIDLLDVTHADQESPQDSAQSASLGS